MKLLSMTLALFGVSSAIAIAPGQEAPNFSAKNQDGKSIKFADLKGKPILVYFYPKDDTPGCTKEACNFRDGHAKFTQLGAVVLGVSRQDAKSHQEFRKKHRLNFDLLVDEDGQLAKDFGIGLMPVVGFHKRQSVLIGRDGKIAKVYSDVNPKTHTDEVLKDIQAMEKSQ